MTRGGVSKNKIDSILELHMQGNTSEALNEINFLITYFPNDEVLFNIRGGFLASLGNINLAIEDYKKSISINSNYSKAYYNLGVSLHEQDKLDEAIINYNLALELDSNNADAHNNLGNAYRSLLDFESAALSFKEAVKINPKYIEAHYSLGLTFQDLNQLNQAADSYQKVIHLKPKFAGMHNNLGNVQKELGLIDDALKSYQSAIYCNANFAEAYYNAGLIYQEINKFDDAIINYSKAIAIKPDYPEAHNNKGIALKEIGKLNNAISCYEEAIKINPNYAEAHNNLGIALKENGLLEQALSSHRKSIELNSTFIEAYNNLGIILMELGKAESAADEFRLAIKIKPDYAEAHNNLGIAYKEFGEIPLALKSYKDAIFFKPEYPEAHNNLGIALMDLGKMNDAVTSFKSALEVRTDYAFAHNNLGVALSSLNQLDDAKNCFERAISINPNYAEAFSNLGNLMTDTGQLEKALKSYQFAYEINPSEGYMLGNIFHTKMHLGLWDDFNSDLDILRKKINSNKKVIGPFALHALIDNPELHKKASIIYGNDKFPKNQSIPFIRNNLKHQKIRVGYFSSDFREHPVSALTAKVYELHERAEFEIYAFSSGPETNDEMQLRIKNGVDYFYNVQGKSYEEIVKLARHIEIDIAVDLGGFTQNARTEIFALSLAPIQLSYIGFLGTMGLEYYDYLIADSTIIPIESQKYYLEKIIYLPSFQANDSSEPKKVTKFSRLDLGLPEEKFIFCCFNNTYKITPSTMDSWMRILKKTSQSVLLIFASNKFTKENLTKEILKRGVDPKRIIFGGHLSRADYFGRYKLADLFLDTSPYNAGTTSSDALKMGLPVITLLGNSYASRMGASILKSVNLPELITYSQEEYESLAIDLASDSKRLDTIKEKLLKNIPSTPLFDSMLFTRNLEKAYHKIYDRNQKGLEPENIYVESFD